MTATARKDSPPFGSLLRNWRQRRRLSQLALGLDTDVSARHISFLESGRARPSRVMVERLADGLDMPLVERNLLLISAGFAPRYTHAPLDDDSLAPALDAMRQLMNAHTPTRPCCSTRPGMRWTPIRRDAFCWAIRSIWRMAAGRT